MRAIDINIFLIGPMGVGKTSVGKRLARRLSMDFFDSDVEVERVTGESISLLFELSGEQVFRRYERQTIAALVQKKNIVLATGGGVVLDQENCQQLSENGLVIYLKANPEKLVSQTRLNKTRPLLQSTDPYRTISTLLQQREPLYQGIADLTIDTNALGIHEVVNNICRRLLVDEKDNS